MAKRTVKRYNTSGILFHWIFSSIVTILVITGIEMFIPGRSAGGGYVIGIIHRIAAVLFIATPILYSIFSPGKVCYYATIKKGNIFPSQ